MIEDDDRPSIIVVGFILFIAFIICAVAIFLAIQHRPAPADTDEITLEGVDADSLTGMVRDYRTVPSHVETVPTHVANATKLEPRSYGQRFFVTLGDATHESEWEISETEYRAVKLGQPFTITNENFKPPFLGVAVD